LIELGSGSTVLDAGLEPAGLLPFPFGMPDKPGSERPPLIGQVTDRLMKAFQAKRMCPLTQPSSFYLHVSCISL
jgi:hypothetical protein